MSPNHQIFILVANGVNLDLLGQREPEIYGTINLDGIHKVLIEDLARLQNKKIILEFYQTNSESDYLEKLSEKSWDGCILNPGAWTHTSLALADRIKGLGLTFIEVHLSNIYAREKFRHKSYISKHAIGVISGFGLESYRLALSALLKKIS